MHDEACLHELRAQILNGVEFLDRSCMRLMSAYISKFAPEVKMLYSEEIQSIRFMCLWVLPAATRCMIEKN